MDRSVALRDIDNRGRVAAAAAAWARVAAADRYPHRIEAVQEEGARSVYRLHAAGIDGESVIAKCSDEATIRHECLVYEELLPALGIPCLRCYGSVWDRSGTQVWLFVEDAGGEPYSTRSRLHQTLAAGWLGEMHVRASRLARPDGLGDTGTGKFAPILQQAITTIAEVRQNSQLTASDVELLGELSGMLEVCRDNWTGLKDFLDSMPRTLVHGDVKADNLRIRTFGSHHDLVAFDWHDGGWGAPALDVAKFLGYAVNPDLETYLDIVGEAWPWMDESMVVRLGYAGELFRSVASIRWEAERLKYEWVETPMHNLAIYRDWLREVVVAEPWLDVPTQGPGARRPKPRPWV